MTMAIDANLATTTDDPLPVAGRCVACGGDRWTPRFRRLVDHLSGEPFDVDRCGGCGLLATRPPPPPEQVGRFYPPRYRGNRHAFTGGMRDALRRRAVQACFPAGFRGRLLDIGCGSGAFARHMRSHGWDVAATELDATVVDTLRADGIDARLPTDADGFAGAPFDAITCWHVMEHVEDPLALARWAATLLSPTGVFQATVPNAGSAQARLFGRRWMHLDVPRHRHHFTPATFGSTMASAGLTVQRRTNFALEYDWFGVIQSALDSVCASRNVLFDRLTRAPDAAGARAADVAVSYALAGPLAAVSLPPLLLAWAAGDGATLTLTCRRA
jgi:SAM-dependent methyltransferase